MYRQQKSFQDWCHICAYRLQKFNSKFSWPPYDSGCECILRTYKYERVYRYVDRSQPHLRFWCHRQNEICTMTDNATSGLTKNSLVLLYCSFFLWCQNILVELSHNGAFFLPFILVLLGWDYFTDVCSSGPAYFRAARFLQSTLIDRRRSTVSASPLAQQRLPGLIKHL